MLFVMAAIYVVQALVCVYCVVVTRGYRTLFSLLLASLVSNAIGATTSVFSSARVVSALFTIWSLPLLFFAIVCMLLHRYAAIHAAAGNEAIRLNPMFRYVLYALLACMIALGTAAASLDFFLPVGDTFLADDVFGAGRSIPALTVGYVFLASWCLTAFDLAGLALSVYKAALQAGVKDKVC